MPQEKRPGTETPAGFHFDEAVNEIVDMARQWLNVGHKTDSNAKATQQHLIESLLAEIHRLEGLNAAAMNEIKRVRCEKSEGLRHATAEECAVICETADYVVRSHGCAREIRMRFGLPLKGTR